jgi:hypothetical protein
MKGSPALRNEGQGYFSPFAFLLAFGQFPISALSGPSEIFQQLHLIQELFAMRGD